MVSALSWQPISRPAWSVETGDGDLGDSIGCPVTPLPGSHESVRLSPSALIGTRSSRQRERVTLLPGLDMQGTSFNDDKATMTASVPELLCAGGSVRYQS